MSNVNYTADEREARDLNVVFDYQRGVHITEIQRRNGMGKGDVYRRLRRQGISIPARDRGRPLSRAQAA